MTSSWTSLSCVVRLACPFLGHSGWMRTSATAASASAMAVLSRGCRAGSGWLRPQGRLRHVITLTGSEEAIHGDDALSE